MRTMYDAVTPGNIPASAQMVAGYIDGRYAWRAADWARFPGAVKVRIAVFASTNDGHVLDCENGDATPGQCPGWVSRRRATGADPTVYCSLAAWGAVRNCFISAGVREPHYWIAAYPGNGPALYAGSVAHQYADPGPVDISVVADYWPGVDGNHSALTKVAVAVVTAVKAVFTRTPPADRGQVIAIQNAVHVTADGKWGAATSLAATAVINRDMSATPAGVRFLQTCVGATADGVWGPLSQADWVTAVKRIQVAIHVVADGNFGPISRHAWAIAYANDFGKF